MMRNGMEWENDYLAKKNFLSRHWKTKSGGRGEDESLKDSLKSKKMKERAKEKERDKWCSKKIK